MALTYGTIANLVYALLLAFGGGMAFLKKGSLPSLLGSLTIALIYIAAFQIKYRAPVGAANSGKNVAMVASVLLLLVGISRYMKVENKTLPTMFISLGVLGVLLELLIG